VWPVLGLFVSLPSASLPEHGVSLALEVKGGVDWGGYPGGAGAKPHASSAGIDLCREGVASLHGGLGELGELARFFWGEATLEVMDVESAFISGPAAGRAGKGSGLASFGRLGCLHGQLRGEELSGLRHGDPRNIPWAACGAGQAHPTLGCILRVLRRAVNPLMMWGATSPRSSVLLWWGGLGCGLTLPALALWGQGGRSRSYPQDSCSLTEGEGGGEEGGGGARGAAGGEGGGSVPSCGGAELWEGGPDHRPEGRHGPGLAERSGICGASRRCAAVHRGLAGANPAILHLSGPAIDHRRPGGKGHGR